MFPCEFDMMEESTRLYEELKSLEVTDQDAVFYLNHPKEFSEIYQRNVEFQKKLHGANIYCDTKEGYMHDVMVYFGRLNSLKEHIRVSENANNGGGNAGQGQSQGRFSLESFLAGFGLGVGGGVPLGFYLKGKIEQSQDEKATEEAMRIMSQLQKYQQQMPFYSKDAKAGSSISDAVDQVKTKAESTGEDVMKLLKRLQSIEEDLEKKKSEESRSKKEVRKNGRKK